MCDYSCKWPVTTCVLCENRGHPTDSAQTPVNNSAAPFATRSRFARWLLRTDGVRQSELAGSPAFELRSDCDSYGPKRIAEFMSHTSAGGRIGGQISAADLTMLDYQYIL